MVSVLDFHGVCIARAGRQVVRSVSFSVGGGIFALLGSNGAGKSTLIAALLDLIPLAGGAIRLWGAPHRTPGARARLAFLPERFLPPWYLTGEEFLRHSLMLRGGGYDPAAARAWSERLHLDPAALGRPVRGYSKGMTQKLGLIAVLLAGCPLLVLDEPMSGLDPLARQAVLAALRAAADAGATLFLTTHALGDCEALLTQPADRLAILHAGELRYVGDLAGFKRAFSSSDANTAYLRCLQGAQLDAEVN